LKRREAVAAVAAALNDVDCAEIGDPRKKQYRVEFRFAELKKAFEFARQLAILGIVPTTTIDHDKFGDPVVAGVRIYGKGEQHRLFEGFKGQLEEGQLRRLEMLVLARGPIPDEIVERMVAARKRGWNCLKIAEKMNEQAIIAGMGGVGWTALKVKHALAEYDKQHGPWSGAEDPESE